MKNNIALHWIKIAATGLHFTLALCLACQLASAQTLVNTNANPNTKAVKKYMENMHGTKILSGQCNDSYFPYIFANTGTLPAIDCFDFNGCTPTGNNPNWNDDQKAISWFQNSNGIVAFQWHWQSPDGTGQWNPGDFNLSNALVNPLGKSFTNMMRDIDIVAGKMLTMQAAGVPIIWRPLHEAEGQWFWWGASGESACDLLYRLMYERLVHYWHLNNLIWVWNSYGTEKGNWYPGDDVVDIISWDYPDTNSWNEFQQLFGGKNKLFGLAEVGKLPDPRNFLNNPWSYFVCWDYMIQDQSKPNGQNPTNWLKIVIENPLTLTRRDMPKWTTSLTAYPGPDQTVYCKDGFLRAVVSLLGSGSTSDAGPITSYTWSEGSQVVATGAVAFVDLPVGNHLLTLTVTDGVNPPASANQNIYVERLNLALGKPVTVSSTEIGFNVGPYAVDGSPATRWSSLYSDHQFIYVDFEATNSIDTVMLNWETASGKDFTVDISNDAKTWTPIVTAAGMTAGARIDTFTGLNARGRYVRMNGTARTSNWGYSLYELVVNGSSRARKPQFGSYSSGPSNQFNCSILAQVGDALAIETSPDLVGWQVILTTNVPAGGIIDFVHDSPRSQPTKFYRVRIQ